MSTDGPEQEPDYRFTLANERTLLAWVRTSLALLAGGVALETFATELQPSWLPQALGICIILIGAVICVAGYFHWRRAQRAMRHNSRLPTSVGGPIVTIGVVFVAVALAVGILL